MWTTSIGFDTIIAEIKQRQRGNMPHFAFRACTITRFIISRLFFGGTCYVANVQYLNRTHAAGQREKQQQLRNNLIESWYFGVELTSIIINSSKRQQLKRAAAEMFVNVRQAADLFVSVLPTNTQKDSSTESSRRATTVHSSEQY